MRSIHQVLIPKVTEAYYQQFYGQVTLLLIDPK
jgi:hypothetical protein